MVRLCVEWWDSTRICMSGGWEESGRDVIGMLIKREERRLGSGWGSK